MSNGTGPYPPLLKERKVEKGLLMPRIQIAVDGMRAEICNAFMASTAIDKEELERAIDAALESFNMEKQVELIVHREMVKCLERTISGWREPMNKKIQEFVKTRLFEIAVGTGLDPTEEG